MVQPRPRPRVAFASALALASVNASALGATLNEPEARKLDPILRQSLERYEAGESIAAIGTTHGSGPLDAAPLFAWPANDAGGVLIPCWIRFDPAEGLPSWLDARIGARGHARARLTPREIERLAGEAGVGRISAARRTRPLLEASVAEVGANVVHAGHGSPPVYSGYAGNGVLLGVVDTGVDLDHADFRNGSSTRLVALWDQTAPTLGPPSNFSYGREWSAAQINSGGSTEVDTEGHGTHVMGIAGGNGSATGLGKPAYRFVGLAPNAALIAVKTDFYTASVVDAVQYVFERATALGVPAVVNLSLGHHFGPHDGTEDTEVALASLVGPGRIVVAAAGNEQADGIHAEGTCAAGDSLGTTLRVEGYLPRSGASNDYLLIDGYYTQATAPSITVFTPSGHKVGPIVPGSKADQNTADGGVYVENEWMDPATDDAEFFVQIYDKLSSNSPVSGIWTITFNRGGTPGRDAEVDMWIYQSTLPAAFAAGRSDEELISSPAAGDSVIAVGAYVTKNSWKSRNGSTYQYSGGISLGTIAPFSSHGPRRDGVRKPDVSAPGMGIGAALSTAASIPVEYVLDDGVHFIDQGTSMAAPHVAGLIALMLQVHGYLSKAEILEKLRQSARSDLFAAGLPNSTWGAGKIDAVGAVTQETGVLLDEVRVTRVANGTLLEWEVPADAATLDFRILRVSESGAEELVAEVGPGPHYSFIDPPRADARPTSYWLVALDSGRPRARFGPFVPLGDEPIDGFVFGAPAPNPARNEVRGTIRVPSAGEVRLEVLNASGRRVRTFAVRSGGPGEVEYIWDGRGDDRREVPAGLYWIRAAFARDALTRRVLLLRH